MDTGFTKPHHVSEASDQEQQTRRLREHTEINENQYPLFNCLAETFLYQKKKKKKTNLLLGILTELPPEGDLCSYNRLIKNRPKLTNG